MVAADLLRQARWDEVTARAAAAVQRAGRGRTAPHDTRPA